MKIVAKSTGGGAKTLIPTGNHQARCYKMVYFGEVDNEYQGKVMKTMKVNLGFEFPTELHEFDKEKGEQPLVISKTYTLSLGEKANLRKDLEAWRSKPFTEDELEGFDIMNVLGKPLMIQIGEKVKADGSSTNVIQSMGSMPKGMKAEPQVNPEFVFSAAEFDQAKFDTMPEWMQKEIKTSTEYQSMMSAGGDQEVSNEASDEKADELPF